MTSVNGLDETELFKTDKDVAFDQALLGAWQGVADNCTVTLTVSGESQTYEFKTTGQGEGCSDSDRKGEYYQGRLLRLDSHLFLDMFPKSDNVCEMCLPLHWIFLVDMDKDSLALTPIDDEWLKRALEQKTVVLTTLQGNTDVLTASSKDLKDFCRKYAGDKEAFKPDPGLRFKRK